MKSLEQAFEYYKQHQDELLKKYAGKFVVIKDDIILGAYDSNTEAYQATIQEHELGTFLIQQVLPGTDSYTQTFHTRVRI